MMEFDVVNIKEENHLKLTIGRDLHSQIIFLRLGAGNFVSLKDNPTRDAPFITFLISQSQARDLAQKLWAFGKVIEEDKPCSTTE